MQKRLTLRFKGRVQGVGFRWESQRIAQGLGLTGWVRNLPDGSVELVAEGKEETCEELLAEIQASRLGAGIRERLVAWAPSQNAFDEFSINYY